MEAALDRTGIALLPEILAREALATGRSVHILLAWRARDSIVHMVFTSRRGMVPATRASVEYVAKELRSKLPAGRLGLAVRADFLMAMMLFDSGSSGGAALFGHFVSACEQCRGRMFPDQSHLIRSMDNSLHSRIRTPRSSRQSPTRRVRWRFTTSALSLVKLRCVD